VPGTPKLAAIQRVTQRVVANKLLLLAAELLLRATRLRTLP